MKNKLLKKYFTLASESLPVWLNREEIAYLRHDQAGRRLMAIRPDTGERRYLSDQEIRTSQLYSAENGTRLYFAMDQTGSECEQIYCLADKSLTSLTNSPGVRHFLGGVSADGKRLAYACNQRQNQSFDIWSMELGTGETRLCQEFSDHYNWPCDNAISPDGRYLLYNKLKSIADNALWITDLDQAKSWRIPQDNQISSEIGPVWLHDSSGFYLLSDRDSDLHNLWFYDLASQKFSLKLSFAWNVDRLALSPDDRYLAILLNRAGYSELKIYDLVLERMVNSLTPPQGVISVSQSQAWSPCGKKLTFSLTSGTRPGGIWLLDLAKEKMEKLTKDQVDSELAELLVEPELRSYRSFDGLEVPYWLSLPNGLAVKNLPVVLDIHGGPEGQRRPGYMDFNQYLLSQGIAVVSPNIRGSSGYGKVYTHLDDREKRLDSVKDIDYLVRHLIETGLADPKKIAVTGGSYGGFMTLSCAARLPDLWACAVDTVGMYNLVTFLENTADYRRQHRESEYGSLDKDREMLLEVSPVSRIQDIKTPMLIIQGKNDPRVPVSEAEQAVAALRSLGREVEYICYEDEGHGIAKLENRLDCYPRVASFIKRHLGLE